MHIVSLAEKKNLNVVNNFRGQPGTSTTRSQGTIHRSCDSAAGGHCQTTQRCMTLHDRPSSSAARLHCQTTRRYMTGRADKLLWRVNFILNLTIMITSAFGQLQCFPATQTPCSWILEAPRPFWRETFGASHREDLRGQWRTLHPQEISLFALPREIHWTSFRFRRKLQMEPTSR